MVHQDALTPSAPSATRQPVLDAMRGLAALSVAWYHFTNTHEGFLPDGLVKWSGKYGFLGVSAFFVISGFVIPYALHNAGYRLRGYGRFLLKRITRLDPPYFAALVLCVALAWTASRTPMYRGEVFRIDPPQILAHLGYVNAFLGYPWIDPVFWSLAVEFQYYLLIGLLFPLLRSRHLGVILGVYLALGGLSFVPVPEAIRQPNIPSSVILPHLGLFLLGFATFQRRIGTLGTGVYLALVVPLGLAACAVLGTPRATAGVVSALVIAFVRLNSPVLNWFGMISYSLYLLHEPVGGRVLHLGSRFFEGFAGRVFLLLLALGVSIGCAYLFYRLVERPAARWAGRVRYRAQGADPGTLPPPIGEGWSPARSETAAA